MRVRAPDITHPARAATLWFGLAALAPIAAAGDDGAPPRPNILWIVAEDMGPELGCFGTSQVHTPHLDRLAAQGVRFTRAFTTAPVCSASRSAFMTGMYQTTIGAHNHRSHRDDGYSLPDGVRLITDWLREAGYFTANLRDLTGKKGETFLRGTGKTDWNFHYEGEPFDGARWSRLKDHQPFYAQLNFSETHRGKAWNTSHEHIERPADPDAVVIPPYYPDHPLTRADWAQYLNTVMALDVKVGRVLERLEADGLADRTVVVFFADHGRAMLRGKQWPYDSGLHVPLILRWPAGIPAPRGYRAGSVDERLISAIDITATTLEIAGVKTPEAMQGRAFYPRTSGAERRHVFGARDRCDETVFRIRTVRDERYRYIRNLMPERAFLQRNRYKESTYPVIALMRELHERGELTPAQAVLMAPTRPAEELYDTLRDPHEIVNLIDSEEHAAVLERLRCALGEFLEESRDQGLTAEPEEVTEYWEKEMARRHQKRLKRRPEKEQR